MTLTVMEKTWKCKICELYFCTKSSGVFLSECVNTKSVSFQRWRSSAAPVCFTCWRRSAATCWSAEGCCRSRWAGPPQSRSARRWELSAVNPLDLCLSNRGKGTWWLTGWRERRRLWPPRTSAPTPRRPNTSSWRQRRRRRKSRSCTPPYRGVWTTISSWIQPDPQRVYHLMWFPQLSSVFVDC